MHLTCFETGDVHALVGENTNTLRFVLKGQQFQPRISKILVHNHQTQLVCLISNTLCHSVFTAVHRAGIDERGDGVDLLTSKCPGIAHGCRLDEGHARV